MPQNQVYFYTRFWFFAIFVLSFSIRTMAQGPLVPTGTPAPVMKSLDQVEPRIPIGVPTTFPFTISAPGSYYLTQNLTVPASLNGIFIESSHVSLDLCGFTITGPGNTGNTAHGISVTGASAIVDITIQNGSIRSFRGEGINIPVGTAGNLIGNVTGVQLRNLEVFSCNLGQGINSGVAGIRTGCIGIMENCVVGLNNNGFIVGNGMIVQNCIADRNTRNGMVIGNNNVIRDCILKNNGQTNNGISDAGLYLPASVTAFPVEAAQNRIENNHFVNNAEFGIQVLATENLIIRNTAVDNGNGTQAANYQIGTGNRYGILTDVSGTGQFSSDQPWANFYY